MIFEAFGRYPYLITTLLMTIGLYGMLTRRHLIQKLIGMNIFQTGIFLFFIQGAAKWGGSIPIIDPELGTSPALYVNPLPHVLILTAIVVAVATTGVALALVLAIHRRYGTLDEEELLKRMRSRP